MARMDPVRFQMYSAKLRHTLAVNVRRLRNERGWSQEALAFEAGLHRTFVAHVEREVRNISLDNVARLALALNVGGEALLAEHLECDAEPAQVPGGG